MSPRNPASGPRKSRRPDAGRIALARPEGIGVIIVRPINRLGTQKIHLFKTNTFESVPGKLLWAGTVVITRRNILRASTSENLRARFISPDPAIEDTRLKLDVPQTSRSELANAALEKAAKIARNFDKKTLALLNIERIGTDREISEPREARP